MILKNLLVNLSTECLKVNYTIEEYQSVATNCHLINSTDLYKIYVMLDPVPVSYKVFYSELKKYLYYDTYYCVHGTEFLYYIKFKDNDLNKLQSKIPTDIINIVKAKL